MPYEQIRLKNQLCHPLYSATNALLRVYKPLLAKLDITYPQYLIMMALWEISSCNIQKLSEMTYFDSGSLTPLLKKLSAQNLIAIKVDKTDKRNRVISLTPKGTALQEKAKSVPKNLLCMMNLNGEEMHELKRLIEELYSHLLKVESAAKNLD